VRRLLPSALALLLVSLPAAARQSPADVAITRAKSDLIWVNLPDGVDLLTKILKLKVASEVATLKEDPGMCPYHRGALKLTRSKDQRVCDSKLDCVYFETLMEDGCWHATDPTRL
jgi:hypothetical protein